MQIRHATMDDLAMLNNLMHLSKRHWGYDEVFMEKFMKKFALRPVTLLEGRTFITSLENKDIGFYNFILNKEGQCELENFFIYPELIGQGIGRVMWEKCLETARTKHISSFVLWADPNADGFYVKMGCTKIGQRPSPMGLGRYNSQLHYDLAV